MANNYIDPTKKGTQGLKGINQLGYDPTTSGLPLSNEEAALLGNLNKKFSDYDDSSLYYNPQVQPDSNWGDSVYDDNIYIGNLDQDVIQNRRADLQGAGVQLLNGVLKGVSTAATTIIDGVVGLPLGIIEAIGQGDVSKIWDNEITQATKGVSDAMEQIAPNYRSVEEEEAPFWENLDTPNFWGDTVIKNFGFLIGAYYGGLPYAKLGQLLTVGGVKTAQFFNASAKAIQNAAKVGNYATKGIHAGASAVVEGSIEAKNNSQDWYNLQKAKTDDYYAQALDELDSTYLKGTPEYDNAYQQIAQAYNYSLQELDQKKKEMGNMDLALNIPILTMSNIIQFAKILGGGFTTGVKGGLNIKGTLGNFRTSVGKHSYLKSGIKNALAEGTEEMTQKIASDFSGNLKGAEYTNYAIDEFRNAKVDVKASKESEDAVTSLGNAIYDNVTSAKSWEEFFVGALFGLVGMPQFGVKDNGKFGFKGMGGGIWNDYKENAEKLKEEQELVDYLNTRGAKELKETWHGLVRNKYYEDQKQEAIANRDEKAYHDANQKQAISDVIMFGKAGKLELLEAQLDDLDKSADNEEFIAKLIEKTKQTKTVDQQKAEIDKENEQIQDENFQESLALSLLEKKVNKAQKKHEELVNSLSASASEEEKSTHARKVEQSQKELDNLQREFEQAQINYNKSYSYREQLIEKNNAKKEALEEYTFGPFMEGDNPMSYEQARKKIHAKTKEVKDIIKDYRKISEEIQLASQGKFSRDQIETLTFLKTQESGNKRRIISLLESLGNIKDLVLTTLSDTIVSAQQELDKAKSENKSEEELKKIEDKVKGYQYIDELFKDILINGPIDPDKLNTLYLENSGFASLLNTLIQSYEGSKDSIILGVTSETMMNRMKQKANDIKQLIEETNLYNKKFAEYLNKPEQIVEEAVQNSKKKEEALRTQETNKVEELLSSPDRAVRARAVSEIKSKQNNEVEEILNKLGDKSKEAYREAEKDLETIEKLYESASKFLGEEAATDESQALRGIIGEYVFANGKITLEEAQKRSVQNGNADLVDLLLNRTSQEEDTLKKLKEFFNRPQLYEETVDKIQRGNAALDRAEAAKSREEEVKSKRVLETSTEPSPNDNSSVSGKLPEPPVEPDKKDTDAPTSTLGEKEETPATTTTKNNLNNNFDTNSNTNFSIRNQVSYRNTYGGLRSWVSLYYYRSNNAIPFLEYIPLYIKQALENETKDGKEDSQLYSIVLAPVDGTYAKEQGISDNENLSKKDIIKASREELFKGKKELVTYKQQAAYKHLEFLTELLNKAKAFDVLQNNQLNANDKIVIELYKGNDPRAYGRVPLIYKVNTDGTKQLIGVALTEFQSHTLSNTKSYASSLNILEFFKENPDGQMTTQVEYIMGGILSLTNKNQTVAEVFQDDTPKLGIVKDVTSTDSSFQSNVFADILRPNDEQQGQCYMLVKTSASNYVPALVSPMSLVDALKDSEFLTELTKAFNSDKTNLQEYLQRLKNYFYLPGLKISYQNEVLSLTFSKKLHFTNGETTAIHRQLSFKEGEVSEDTIKRFFLNALKECDYENTLSINVNINNLNNDDYVKFISKYLYVNVASPHTINDWFTYKAPSGIKTPNSKNSNTLNSDSNTPNTPVQINDNTTVDPNTGTVSRDDDTTINDDKEAQENQNKAQNNTSGVVIQTQDEYIEAERNLFANSNTLINDNSTDTSNDSTDDSNDAFDDTEDDDSYHSGVYREVTKGSMLDKYFTQQREKVATISPKSESNVPKNLNSTETENFNSCQ